jgi:anti-sigma B factor antagonist
MSTFRVLGALDVSTAATVRAELTDLLAADGTDDLIVDLTQLGSLDTVGLGLLVGIHRQAQRRGRRLVLTGVPPRVMRVLAITKLRRVLTIDDELRAIDGRTRVIELTDVTILHPETLHPETLHPETLHPDALHAGDPLPQVLDAAVCVS